MSNPRQTPNLISERQRAWLGGFVFGLTGIRPDLSPPVTLEPWQPAPEADAEGEPQYPWHDSDLPIVDRMALAADKPVEDKLMAAMAQLDCGSCGYVCRTYSQAIATGEEPNLTLCSPGGSETRRVIKQVLRDAGGARPGPTSTSRSQPSGWSRQNPFKAKLIESRRLNLPGSEKDTRHVAIDLCGSGISYAVGDALGVYPTNCPELAAMIIRQLKADPKQLIESPLQRRRTLAEVLLQDCCLKSPSDELLELLSERTGDAEVKDTFQKLVDQGVPDGCDVLDVLQLASDCEFGAAEVIECLDPLNPRLYSIASSMKLVGDEVHLTVGKVTYTRDRRLRKGVASTMLANRVRPGEIVRVFVQPNHAGFSVPTNTAAPMIMIGPGTGIAPFIAFLQERAITAAPGKNWLFFGDQHKATDFLYRDELVSFMDQGVLTRLDTAFSRDGHTKVYVQDRMRQNAPELWRWLKDGAYVFVCGDASRMARDVHQSLVEIVAEQSGRTADKAKAWIGELADQGRYIRDVY